MFALPFPVFGNTGARSFIQSVTLAQISLPTSWVLCKGSGCRLLFLNLWAANPLIKPLSPKILALQFITMARLPLWSDNENNFMLKGVATIWGTVLKGSSIREVETRWYKQRSAPPAWILNSGSQLPAPYPAVARPCCVLPTDSVTFPSHSTSQAIDSIPADSSRFASKTFRSQI